MDPSSPRLYKNPKWLLIGCAAFFLCVSLMSASKYLANADAQSPSEYELKSAFIYHFVKFIEWPAGVLSERGEFVLGILGDDPFGTTIEAAMEEKVLSGGTRIIVRRYGTAEAAAKECHALFIGPLASPASIKQTLRVLEGKPILTISDAPGFESSGGMIRFVMDQKKVRFTINQTAAEKAGLKISSQLLKLAKQ